MAAGATLAFPDRVLPFGTEAADAAGEIADAAVAIGRHTGFADVAIAGTTRAKDLTVRTENLRQFQPLGAPVCNLAGMAEHDRGFQPAHRRYSAAAPSSASASA